MRVRFRGVVSAITLTFVLVFSVTPVSAYAATTTNSWNNCPTTVCAYPNATWNLPTYRSSCYVQIGCSATYYREWWGWMSQTSYTIRFYDACGRQVWSGHHPSGSWMNYYVGPNVCRIVMTPGTCNYGGTPCAYFRW